MVTIAFASCYQDNEEELVPCPNGIGAVTYNASIKPILLAYGCIGCHSSAAAGGGILLEQYSQVKTVVDNGRLQGSINHAPGFKAMPQGGIKMSSCDISRIEAWIKAGAPNN